MFYYLDGKNKKHGASDIVCPWPICSDVLLAGNERGWPI